MLTIFLCCLFVTFTHPFASAENELSQELEPPQEYPQPPKQKKQGLKVERPTRKDSQGAYYYPEKTSRNSQKPYGGVQKPYRIDSDGSYHYSDEEAGDAQIIDGVEAPIDHDGEGGYYYSRKKEKKKSNKKAQATVDSLEKPSEINSDGSYLYDLGVDAARNSLFFRGGVYGPPSIKSVNDGGRNYDQVYGNSSEFIFTLEYDWALGGGFYIKAGTGLTTATGEGQFANGANPGITPKEKFTLYIFPNTVSLSYKFQLFNFQYLTPYVEAGPGYFTFMEMRSDGDQTKFGGAPVLTATGGLLFSLTKFQSGTNAMSDYGITQTWLDLQFKQIIGLDNRKDFTANMISGGFAVGF